MFRRSFLSAIAAIASIPFVARTLGKRIDESEVPMCGDTFRHQGAMLPAEMLDNGYALTHRRTAVKVVAPCHIPVGSPIVITYDAASATYFVVSYGSAKHVYKKVVA